MISVDLEEGSINLKLEDGCFRAEVQQGQWKDLTGYLAFSQIPALVGMNQVDLEKILKGGSCKVEFQKQIFLLTLELPEQLAIEIKITEQSIKLRNLKRQDDRFLKELDRVKQFIAVKNKTQAEVAAQRNVKEAQAKAKKIREDIKMLSQELSKKNNQTMRIDVYLESQNKELQTLNRSLNESMTMRDQAVRELNVSRSEIRGPSRSTIIATFQKTLSTYREKERNLRQQIQRLTNECCCQKECPAHP